MNTMFPLFYKEAVKVSKIKKKANKKICFRFSKELVERLVRICELSSAVEKQALQQLSFFQMFAGNEYLALSTHQLS